MADLEKRERFGRYLILDHLVDGGMAKICRARFLGEQADKVVAIKMVQPQFSKDEAFKTMFMDEIKVTFGLLHPNVIQTYDYGMQKGQLFVAMEYCDGRNLKEYLDKLKERKFVFPVEISTYIISQACQGLFYAHTFRDKLTGQETNIIHRDISPHNIMLTYDGTVKIIDFGIAKSQTNSEATQAGTIKGKLSYLAPEYLEGLELDARYDQFALGITLWEMLCSRKLFKENNDLAVLKKIQECKIPVPSSINPNVPKELDEIVLKALSKNRSKRYENLDQFNRALMKFLYAKYPDFNSTDLSYFSQELFREEIKKDREKMFEYGKIDIKPYLEELKKESERGSGVNEAGEKVTSTEALPIKRESVLDFGFEEDPAFTKKKSTVTVRKTAVNAKDKTILNEDATGVKNVSEFNENTLTNLKKSAGTKSSVKKEGTKIISRIDTKKSKGQEGKTSVGTYAALFAFILGGAYYYYISFFAEPEVVVSTETTSQDSQNKKRKPAAEVNLVSEAKGEAKISLSHFDKQKMNVYLDGKKVNVDLLNTIIAPVGIPFTLRVQIEGRKHFIKEMNLQNNSQLEIEIGETQSVAYGYLYTSKECQIKGEIRFELFGEKRVSPVPMLEEYGIGFPLQVDTGGFMQPATYEIYFKKAGDDIERKIEINIKKEDQSIDLCEMI
jgi:serine/threonine protein kinase